MKAGDAVLIDWPGSAIHGKRVRIEAIDPALNLAPEGHEPVVVEAILIRHPGLFGGKERVALGRWAIAGTVENVDWRREREESDERQGELAL